MQTSELLDFPPRTSEPANLRTSEYANLRTCEPFFFEIDDKIKKHSYSIDLTKATNEELNKYINIKLYIYELRDFIKDNL